MCAFRCRTRSAEEWGTGIAGGRLDGDEALGRSGTKGGGKSVRAKDEVELSADIRIGAVRVRGCDASSRR